MNTDQTTVTEKEKSPQDREKLQSRDMNTAHEMALIMLSQRKSPRSYFANKYEIMSRRA